jgi:hypothetical protein
MIHLFEKFAENGRRTSKREKWGNNSLNCKKKKETKR